MFITGGAGYVGSRVAAHLLAEGLDVTVFDKLIYGGTALLPFAGRPSFRFAKGDVRNSETLAGAMSGHDAVIHLAAIVGEDACDLDPEAAERTNRDAAIDALRLAEAAGIPRFLFFSTCSNYGLSDPNVLADEDSELRPLSLYARTKVDVERHLIGYRGVTATTVLRLGTICGLSARMRFDLLVSEMARAAALGRRIEIYKPAAWRPFLHIADAARAALHVLGEPAEKIAGRVFNVVGENYQKRGLMELVRKHFPDAVIDVTDAQPDKRDYRVSAQRIKQRLGFVAKHTVEEAFVETANAVADGVFVDPFWPGHSAIPLAAQPALGRA